MGSIGFLGFLFFLDMVLVHKQQVWYVFYVPMFVELAILGLAFGIFYLSLPEACCSRKVRFFNIYLSSFFLFTLLWINVIYESHVIIYDTLKVNSNNYDEDYDDWWKYENVYHKGE